MSGTKQPAVGLLGIDCTLNCRELTFYKLPAIIWLSIAAVLQDLRLTDTIFADGKSDEDVLTVQLPRRWIALTASGLRQHKTGEIKEEGTDRNETKTRNANPRLIEFR